MTPNDQFLSKTTILSHHMYVLPYICLGVSESKYVGMAGSEVIRLYELKNSSFSSTFTDSTGSQKATMILHLAT